MPSKTTYRLINPNIEGSIDTLVKAKNSFRAGKKMYENISSYFTNHLDRFNMTLQNIDTKDLTHFEVEEDLDDNGTVDYKLTRMEGDFDQQVIDKLMDTIDNQSGGAKSRKKRKHSESDSDSTSSDSEDYYRYPIQPITRYVYYSLPYYQLTVKGLTPLDASRLFVPMFNLPVNPTIEVNFSLYNVGPTPWI